MRRRTSSGPKRNRVGEIQAEYGCGNVFADLGLPNPELLLVKSAMVHRITTILSARQLTQKQSADILGIDQPGVSDLVRGHLHRFSADRLIRFLNALGKDVEVVITDRAPRSRRPGRLRVRGAGPRPTVAATRLRPRPAASPRKAARTAPAAARAHAGGRHA